MALLAETERDLAVLTEIGPLVENGEYFRATPCVRLTFIVDGNLTERAERLDDWLKRAAELARPEVEVYGGSGQTIPYAQRRRPKPTDWSLFDGFSQRLADDLASGTEHNPNSIPQESGSFFFGDTLTHGASATRFYAMGSHPWRFSLSLSLPLWQQQAGAMDKLVEDLAALGDVYDSGGYGFAMNLWDNAQPDREDALYLPISQRFQLVDIIDPQLWRDSKLESLGPGGKPVEPLPKPLLYPIMPWTLLGKAALEANDIPLQSVRDIAADVFELQESEAGFLVKLWAGPLLGDVNTDPDLSPAFALGRVLAPAILGNLDRMEHGDMARLGWPENKAAWYRRFVDLEPPDELEKAGFGDKR